MSDRMPTELFVSANVRKCQSENIPVYVEKKGDPNSGMIMLKVLDADFKCRIFSQMRDIDGNLKWFDRLDGERISEGEAAQISNAAKSGDPDLWVIEIETRDGENPFDGKLIEL